MNYGLLLYLKLARVYVGNVSKKGEKMEGIITWSIFASWCFNWTLSIYLGLGHSCLRSQYREVSQRLGTSALLELSLDNRLKMEIL